MNAKNFKSRAAWLILALGLGVTSLTIAASKKDKDDKDDKDDDKPVASQTHMNLEDKDSRMLGVLQGKFTKDGVDTCVNCHDEDNEYPVFSLFKTKHAVKADARTPFGHDNKQCESCHGPGNTHAKAKKADKRSGNIIYFGNKAWTPVQDQNDRCLSCHQNHQRIGWKGSTHEFNNLACASCHKVHVSKDPILLKQERDKICLTCHVNQQGKFLQASHHPVREGRMSCTDCHDIHGTKGSSLLVKTLSREKCGSCHAEKRGPYLWEHAPAAEDCTVCHDPHGSNQRALLKKRPPQLCQECHSTASHPSVRQDGSVLANNMFLGAKGCLNCHSAVHGSNHPTGATLLR